MITIFRKQLLLSFFLSILGGALSWSQPCNCKPLRTGQGLLELNGLNSTLIDNALRYFELSSIGDIGDSLVRIWILEDNYPDTPSTWQVKMFEFGKKLNVPFAKYYKLAWGYTNDSTLPVKCVSIQKIYPDKGWDFVGQQIRRLNLAQLYKSENNVRANINVDYGMLILQFLNGNTTKTFDFTSSEDIYAPLNDQQTPNSKKLVSLLLLIKKYFDLNLSVDSKGRDFLDRKIEMLEPIPDILIKRSGGN